ncbi:helix-turn-helix domain-containing protein [Aquimarina longa]|uniref:helix-turn-helix domain-containing protein n=1 Tax=Aquimarina longa TaxID=1080221 RepID=UPI00078578CD|nr:helix-turn-helix transcriptional regulator [Aquimarina longa]
MDKVDYTKRQEAIAKRIKELRINAGYTSYKKFAIEHNFENKSVWRWEEGVNYTVDTLFKIMDIHNITIEEFFKGMK